MQNNALNFAKNRGNSITNDRIFHILRYIIDCYHLIKKDVRIYSKEWVKQNTTFNFEDYLKIELVDNYLIPNKALLIKNTSELLEINFSYETQKRYKDLDSGKERPDKIDIFINKLGLQKVWNDQDENIYFAIECKRIEKLSDCNKYILDIQAFSDRNYHSRRLPFEGQIAFIETHGMNHSKISKAVNKKLTACSSISTLKYLKRVKIHNDFKGSYLSTHKRNHTKGLQFSIFHLLFDYSPLVV